MHVPILNGNFGFILGMCVRQGEKHCKIFKIHGEALRVLSQNLWRKPSEKLSKKSLNSEFKNVLHSSEYANTIKKFGPTERMVDGRVYSAFLHARMSRQIGAVMRCCERSHAGRWPSDKRPLPDRAHIRTAYKIKWVRAEPRVRKYRACDHPTCLDRRAHHSYYRFMIIIGYAYYKEYLNQWTDA